MRLLNIHTLKLERFHDVSHTPRYVILSHQWSLDEVLFEDLWESPERRELAELSRRLEALQKIVLNVKADIDDKVPANSDGQQNEARGYVWEYQTADGLVIDYPHLKRSAYKYGWSKVSGSCQKAMQFGYQYIWLDTICIDKSSSSELSESINSMFNWYKGASMCFAYLQDTPRVSEEPNCLGKPCFTKSEWFRRGWTLQGYYKIAHSTITSLFSTRAHSPTRCSALHKLVADHRHAQRSFRAHCINDRHIALGTWGR